MQKMKIRMLNDPPHPIAVLDEDGILIHDVQSALDLIMTVSYETQASRIVLKKEQVCEEFFDLKTRIAGEILQKFVTYRVAVAIIGDFSIYHSKSLRDFIYESNQGRHIFFLENEEAAVRKFRQIP